MSRSIFAGVATAVMVMLTAAIGPAPAFADSAPATEAAKASVTGVVVQPRGDGCTNVPDSYLGANFRPACDKHDRCYSRNSTTDRIDCDKQLLANLGKACKAEFGKFNPLRYGCLDTAGKYYLGVRAFGRSHYNGKGKPD